MIRLATLSDAESIAKIQIKGWRQAYKDIFPYEFLHRSSYEEKTGSTSICR